MSHGKVGIGFLVLSLFAFSTRVWGVTERAAQAPSEQEAGGAGVKYKAGKELSFEELLIQGQLARPEIAVVTGNSQQGTNGLLRLRENFLDRMTADAGEEIQP